MALQHLNDMERMALPSQRVRHAAVAMALWHRCCAVFFGNRCCGLRSRVC
jgi:hypothetical protein